MAKRNSLNVRFKQDVVDSGVAYDTNAQLMKRALTEMICQAMRESARGSIDSGANMQATIGMYKKVVKDSAGSQGSS